MLHWVSFEVSTLTSGIWCHFDVSNLTRCATACRSNVSSLSSRGFVSLVNLTTPLLRRLAVSNLICRVRWRFDSRHLASIVLFPSMTQRWQAALNTVLMSQTWLVVWRAVWKSQSCQVAFCVNVPVWFKVIFYDPKGLYNYFWYVESVTPWVLIPCRHVAYSFHVLNLNSKNSSRVLCRFYYSKFTRLYETQELINIDA